VAFRRSTATHRSSYLRPRHALTCGITGVEHPQQVRIIGSLRTPALFVEMFRLRLPAAVMASDSEITLTPHLRTAEVVD